MAAMMRQSHTNVHPARESKGMADKTKTDEAQWLGSRSSTLVGTCSPSGWMRRTLSLPSCHAARRAKINANDINRLMLKMAISLGSHRGQLGNAISTGAVRQP